MTDLDDDEPGFWDDARATPRRRPPADDPWFINERELAETVPCRDCHAPISTTCHVVGDPKTELRHFPAHPHRITDARKTARKAAHDARPAR